MEYIKTFSYKGKDIKAIVLDEIEDWKNEHVFIVYHNTKIKKIVVDRNIVKKVSTIMYDAMNPEFDKKLGIIPNYEIAPNYE